MKRDYETSCEEIDISVDLAQSYPGVWGTRLTGGGFGGCTVILVEQHHV
jgi:galactokinase